MLGGVKANYDCVKAFSETHFTKDRKQIDIPVLVLHGTTTGSFRSMTQAASRSSC